VNDDDDDAKYDDEIKLRRMQLQTPCLLPDRNVLSRLAMVSKAHFPVHVQFQGTAEENDDIYDTSRKRLSHVNSKNSWGHRLLEEGTLWIKRKRVMNSFRSVDNTSSSISTPTFLYYFDRFFAQEKVKTMTRSHFSCLWTAFCQRVVRECEVQHKPELLTVYLNAKLCEQRVLSGRFANTFMVANVQLMQLHMELEGHMFQYEDNNMDDVLVPCRTNEDNGRDPPQHAVLAQLINEDFILGCSNALWSHFAAASVQTRSKRDTECRLPETVLEAAYIRYSGSPRLLQLE
jgi:hypothetical protein